MSSNFTKIAKGISIGVLTADPGDGQNGDIYYNSTSNIFRKYENGMWLNLSGASANVFDDITLTPQMSDPGSPVEGMIFMSDGTSRAEGLWIYVNGGWNQITGLRYQEFTFKDGVMVATASTANITLASLVIGLVVDGITLQLDDRVLLKNQTTSSENGVYLITAGAPVRHSTADTATKLSRYVAYVGWGGYADGNDSGNRVGITAITNVPTVSQLKAYYQDNVLSTLSDTQSWKLLGTDAITALQFIVPSAVYELDIEFTGAGGGAGGGAGVNDNQTPAGCGGGGGGAGYFPVKTKVKVNPNETISILLGVPGTPGKGGLRVGSGSANAPGTAGIAGGLTRVYGTFFYLKGAGGTAGSAGQSAATTPGGSSLTPSYPNSSNAQAGGAGGWVATLGGTSGSSAQDTHNALNPSIGGAAGGGGRGGCGGGGGGTGAVNGPNGGDGGTHISTGPANSPPNSGLPGLDAQKGAGGSGGGGSRTGNSSGTNGAAGGHGGFGGGAYIKISY
jgi:hypothetical protein